jgi:hypothetical protein
MTLMEFLVAVIALAAVVVSVCVVMTVRRMFPLARKWRVLLTRSNRTLLRLNRVAVDMEEVSRDLRLIESRVSHSAHGLLDQVEPALRMLGALLTGARTSLDALFHSNGNGRFARHPRQPQRSRT